MTCAAPGMDLWESLRGCSSLEMREGILTAPGEHSIPRGSRPGRGASGAPRTRPLPRVAWLCAPPSGATSLCRWHRGLARPRRTFGVAGVCGCLLVPLESHTWGRSSRMLSHLSALSRVLFVWLYCRLSPCFSCKLSRDFLIFHTLNKLHICVFLFPLLDCSQSSSLTLRKGHVTVGRVLCP